MPNFEDLRQKLHRLDNRGYKAYKDIRGSYDSPNFTLIIDYVQGDPYAAPSKLRVQVPQSVAKFPHDVYRSRSREIALRDYFDVADTVIAMENFVPHDVTQEARAIARKYAAERTPEGGTRFGDVTSRIPLPDSLDPSRGRRSVKLKVRDVDEVVFGTEDIDLSAVEQIVDESQVRAVAEAMVYAKRQYMNGRRPLPNVLDRVMQDIGDRGLDILTPFTSGDLAMFRRFELAAALNRLRTLEVRQSL